MKTLIAIFAFLLIFLAGCQKEESIPISVQDETTFLLKGDLPFKASIEGTGRVILPSSYCNGGPAGEFTGTGNAAHIGNFTYTGMNCIQPLSPQSGNILNGYHTIITADGDKIFSTYTGTYVTTAVPGNPPTPGTVTYSAELEIIGGTGRFTGATGELTANLEAYDEGQNLPKTLTNSSISGTIHLANLKPFSGKMNGHSEVLAASCDAIPNMLFVQARDIELGGHSSLGEVTSEHQHCNYLMTPNEGVIKSGVATLHTPDGDIFVEYEGAFTFDKPYPTCTISYINTLTAVITGGTEKYAGASGSIDAVGTQYLNTSGAPTPVELTFKGYLIK